MVVRALKMRTTRAACSRQSRTRVSSSLKRREEALQVGAITEVETTRLSSRIGRWTWRRRSQREAVVRGCLIRRAKVARSQG